LRRIAVAFGAEFVCPMSVLTGDLGHAARVALKTLSVQLHDRTTVAPFAGRLGRAGTLIDDSVGMRATRAPAIVCLAGLLAAGVPLLVAGQLEPVPIAERARGAERVAVGRVTAVTPAWQVNEFGDRLIVSTVRVAVDEHLKGPAAPTLDVEVEGGTIGDLTLHVSDQEPLAPGERAVFFLGRGRGAAFKPHLRGLGLLKLDATNRVRGSSLTLDIIRREVAAASR
jgi:hypothetical protein